MGKIRRGSVTLSSFSRTGYKIEYFDEPGKFHEYNGEPTYENERRGREEIMLSQFSRTGKAFRKPGEPGLFVDRWNVDPSLL